MCVRQPSSTCTGCATGAGSVYAWIATTFVSRNEKGSPVSPVIVSITRDIYVNCGIRINRRKIIAVIYTT